MSPYFECQFSNSSRNSKKLGNEGWELGWWQSCRSSNTWLQRLCENGKSMLNAFIPFSWQNLN